MLSAQTLHVAINRPCDEVYAFLSQPENFPLWAKGLANSLRREDEDWVTLPDGGVVYVPLRALANRRGTEVIFTLFRQPDMDDALFARDAELVNADLQALKHYLESS